MSQGAFAAAIGVHQATVSRYASGKKRPSLAMLVRIKAVTEGAVGVEDFPETAAKFGRMVQSARKASRK
jgi:transcriptional regulator with XRE-family HTH domain